MVDIAHQSDVKVAVHVNTPRGLQNYLSVVDSIEHGCLLHEGDVIRSIAQNDSVIWVPTLAAYYSSSGTRPEMWNGMQKTFRAALEAGMDNIACGGDTGVFNHGLNALEMKLMVRLGANYKRVLRWCTLGGWKCLRPASWKTSREGTGGNGDHDQYFGAIKPGWAADLIALEGDIEQDFEGTLDRVSFVMRGGKVYKRDGKEVV